MQKSFVTDAERSLFACVSRSRAITDLLKRSGIQSIPGREDVLIAGNSATWDMFYMAAYIYSDNSLDIIENVKDKTFTVSTNVSADTKLQKTFTVLTPDTSSSVLHQYFPIEKPDSLDALTMMYEEALGSPIVEMKSGDVFRGKGFEGRDFEVKIHRIYRRALDHGAFVDCKLTHEGTDPPTVDLQIREGKELRLGNAQIHVLTADPSSGKVRLFFSGSGEFSHKEGEHIHPLSRARVVDMSPTQNQIHIMRKNEEKSIGVMTCGRCLDMNYDGVLDAMQMTYTDDRGETRHEHFHLNKPKVIFHDVHDVMVTVVRVFGKDSVRLMIDGPGIAIRDRIPIETTRPRESDREKRLPAGTYQIFGDGSAGGSLQIGSWAYRIERIDRSVAEERSDIEGGISPGKIQRMELKAIAHALERIPDESTVHVYCDHDYVRLGIDVIKGKSDTEILLWHRASMIRARIRNTVHDANKDLWEKIRDALQRGVTIEYHAVTRSGPAHQRCHNLANSTRRTAERRMGR